MLNITNYLIWFFPSKITLLGKFNGQDFDIFLITNSLTMDMSSKNYEIYSWITAILWFLNKKKT